MILIDGSNLYYSTTKKGYKIDFKKLINVLTGDRELVNAYYYVAPLDIETNEEKYWAHQRFLDMLNEIPRFNVVLCTLKKIKAKSGEYIFVVKGDDVKLSNKLLMGAVEDLYDVAIVVSGDEDFIDSVKIARKKDRLNFHITLASPVQRILCLNNDPQEFSCRAVIIHSALSANIILDSFCCRHT